MTDCCCFFTISTSEVGIVEWCGEFSHLAQAGFNLLCCPFAKLRGIVSLKVQSLNCQAETKTKDNVFVTVNVNVQYQAIFEKVYQAFYTLSDHESQMRAYVYDVIRASLTQMNLDDAFESKEELSQNLKHHLQEVFNTYGFTILQALVTDLNPEDMVKDAMNEINAAKRLKEAAYQRAEGEKVVKVKKAEAGSESMYLSGVGIARERKAIMEGLKESVVMFSKDVHGVSPKDVMDLLVLNQYFDTINAIGSNKDCKVVFLPNDENSARSALLEAEAAQDNGRKTR